VNGDAVFLDDDEKRSKGNEGKFYADFGLKLGRKGLRRFLRMFDEHLNSPFCSTHPPANEMK
jgi:hypothetical protein